MNLRAIPRPTGSQFGVLCSPAIYRKTLSPLTKARAVPTRATSSPHSTHCVDDGWLPACLLNGWMGAGSLMFSMAAVTAGTGLLGSGFDIAGPGSLLAALSVLGLTVGIHEAGHFTAARSQGIHVTKFAIGFGPNLVTFNKDGVEYSLRALPLGGFVAFPDDDPDSPFPKDDPDLLTNRKIGDRIKVVTAGVLANVALAFAICVIQAGTVGIPSPIYSPGVRLGDIMPGTIAAQAGLRQGDIVVSVGRKDLPASNESVRIFVDAIKTSAGTKVPVSVLRGEKKVALSVIPKADAPDGGGRIGVSLQANASFDKIKAKNPLAAVQIGAKQCWELTGRVATGLSQFITNFKQTASQVSGPVKILAVGAEVARTDASGLFQFAALVNINLAIVNILPLPGLDGGYLVFMLLEALRGGKKLDEDVEKGIMASGMLLLMTTGMFLIARDVVTLTGL